MMHSMSLSLVPVHGEVVAGTAAHSVGARLMRPTDIHYVRNIHEPSRARLGWQAGPTTIC